GERLRFARQLGVEDVIVHPYAQSYMPDSFGLPTEGGEWGFEELVQFRSRIEDAGLRLGAIENLPQSFYDDVILGREGADEQLAAVKRTVRNLGRAGVPILGYHWMASRVWRSSLTRPARGGAETTAFDLAEMADAPNTHGREYTEAELWANYERFLDAVLPVAEEAGVTLCLHPDDPPVPELGGVPRLFRSVEALDRALSYRESESHGLELALGVLSEMGEADRLPELIRRWGDRIGYVHFRDVEGTVPEFHEVFLDEGNYDEYAVVGALADAGFDGMLIPDHVPDIEGEPEWGPRGRAYTVGYIRGLVRAYYAEHPPS
ncbi:MAG: mannonate dehydratase, partial [Halobacteriaceae archaeon]